jgi:hypothetical protein
VRDVALNRLGVDCRYEFWIVMKMRMKQFADGRSGAVGEA